MKKPSNQQLRLAASCLVCVIVALGNTYGVEETEVSGGFLTGPLLQSIDIGTFLFVLAFIVAFLHLRIAGAIGLASSLLCLPLYLYVLAPIPFHRIFGFGHPFKVQPAGGFHWDNWAIAGMLALGVTIYVCLRGFAVTKRKQTSEPR